MRKNYERLTCAVCGTTGQSTHQVLDGLEGWVHLTRRGRIKRSGQIHEFWVCHNPECVKKSGDVMLQAPDYTKEYKLEQITETTCDCCGKTVTTDRQLRIGGHNPLSSWHEFKLTEPARVSGLPPQVTRLDACSLKCLADLATKHSTVF